MALTKAQQIMIDNGFPAELLLSSEQRAEAWKGHKLTKPRDLKAPRKDEDPATRQLRKELIAAEKAKTAERFERLAELKKQTSKASTATTEETTMKKTAKKATAKTAAKTKNIGRKNAGAKTAARHAARTTVSIAPPSGRKAEVTAMLKRADGVTVDQVCAKTGMLAHSARALISGIAKTEKVEKTKVGSDPTVYKIAAKGA